MANFDRLPFPFRCTGMNLSLPCDQLPPDKYRILRNVRTSAGGLIYGRPGITPVSENSLIDPIHSIKRLNDPIPPHVEFLPALLIVGLSDKLYYGECTLPTQFLNPLNYYDGGAGVAEIGWSGNPVSFAVATSDLVPRPHLFIADSNKLRKVNTSKLCHHWGVAHPNFAPVATLTALGSDGPDIGTSGVPYRYRFVARTPTPESTGCISNPGPPTRVGIDGNGCWIEVQTVSVHEDPQMLNLGWLDIYRYGGTLPEWIYIGTIPNAAGVSMYDIFPDSAIAANPRLQFDNDQPFVTLGMPASGKCTVAGNTVTWSSGDKFLPYPYVFPFSYDTAFWPLGTPISIGGKLATLYRAPTSDVSLEIAEDDFDTVGPVDFLIASPEQVHSPLQCIWGPFGGGSTGIFIFGVGDPLRPGAEYWTKGNTPESHSSTRVLDITDASERLQNGCMYDGRSIVFSINRMFVNYPSFGEISEFTAVEVPNSKGLFARWALAVGPKIWFLAKDGIYETTGGTPICISDPDLTPLFHTEESAVPFEADGQDGDPFPHINFSKEQKLRLTYADKLLYFDYEDVAGYARTLVYDTVVGGWVSVDTYTPGVACRYDEEGPDLHREILGSVNGGLYCYSGASDNLIEIAGHVRTGAQNAGDPRSRKLWGDVLIDHNTACEHFVVQLGFNNYTFFTTIEDEKFDTALRRRTVGDIQGGKGQNGFNCGLDISWAVTYGTPVLYLWEISVIKRPELTRKRVTDWTDLGRKASKFIQGVRIAADTLGIQRTIDIHKDGGLLALSLAINHDSYNLKPYSFPQPFLTHLVRFHPNDEEWWQLFDLEWVWEPAPDLVTNWITQETTHDFQGFFHHRDGYLALMSQDVVTLRVRADGVNYSYNFASTGGDGVYAKLPVVFEPMKAKAVSYALTSPQGFRLFLRDCELRVKQWGDPGPYINKLAFGDISRATGATI